VKFTGNLLDHQQRALDWLNDRDRSILALDTGLGKTFVAMPWLAQHHEQSTGQVLWITQAALINQTVQRLQEYLPDATLCHQLEPFHRGSCSRTQNLAHQERWSAGPPDIYVCSYQHLKKVPATPGQLVVLDEASAFKTAHNGTWKSVRNATRKAGRVLALTATPVDNHPDELHAIASAIGITDLIDVDDCAVSYVDDYGGRKFTSWREPDGLALFNQHIGSHVYYHRDDTGKPVRVGQQRVYVPLLPAQKRKAEFWLDSRGHREPWWWNLSPRDRLRRGMDAALWPNGSASPVADAAIADALARDDKVILYTESVSDGVPYLCGKLDTAGVGYRNIEGSSDQTKRAQALHDFQHNPDVRVLVASQVLEYGLDLQFCRVLISIDTSWNPSREEQREGRICRLGSPHETYEHVVYTPDLDIFRRKDSVLDRKAAMREDIYAGQVHSMSAM